nr:ATP-binding protein [Methylococcales bacterium]
VEAMKSMVNAFSDYARPSRQKTVLLDLNKLIEEVLVLYSFQSSILVKSRLEQGLSQVEADPVRIRQVLHNLFKNATEAMVSTQDAKIVVSTRQWVEQGSVGIELRVEDNGPGIPVDRVDRVFDPYVTDKMKGTGLGLAIVKKIIEEHGGIIIVDPDYRAGAAFVVRLPVLPVADATNIQDQENASG